jgi:erythromycin esterase
MKQILAIISVVILAACSGGDLVPPIIEPPPTTLPSGVYELSGTSFTLPATDLQPLRDVIGGARFVALGESTHTSQGYYAMKARLVRYMVEELGFRALAWETNWLEAKVAARYVASCEGTAESALASLTGVWRDTSVRDLLRWLCEYNRAHPADPVFFYGFDVQEPWANVPALRQFIERVAAAEQARIEPLLRCIGASATGSSAFFASQEFRDHAAGIRNSAANQECMNGIAALEAWVASGAAHFAVTTSHAAVEEARLALVSLRAWQEQLWVPDPGGFQARDFGMAELTRRVHALDAPGRKTIIWAWNWHIALRYPEVRGFNNDPNAVLGRHGARAMGSFLHDALGADYLPIALIGYRVLGTSVQSTPPVPTHELAVELRLRGLGRQNLLVDLRQPAGGTLLPPGRTLQVSQEWTDPYRQFGALIWLEDSPPMTLVSANP